MAPTTRVVSLRLPNELRDRIDAAVKSANRPRFGEQYTFNSWVIQAIEEKLAKLERGRKKRGNVEPAAAVADQVEPAGQVEPIQVGPDIDATLFGWEDRGPGGEDLTAEWEAGLPPQQ